MPRLPLQMIDDLIGAGMVQWSHGIKPPSLPGFLSSLVLLGLRQIRPVAVPDSIARAFVRAANQRGVPGVSRSDVELFYGSMATAQTAGEAFRLGGESAAVPIAPTITLGYGPNYPVSGYEGGQIFRVLLGREALGQETIFRTAIIPFAGGTEEQLMEEVKQTRFFHEQNFSTGPTFVGADAEFLPGVFYTIQEKWSASTLE